MKYAVIGDYINPDDAIKVGDTFPDCQSPDWHTFSGPREYGKQEGKAHIAGERVEQIHDELFRSVEFMALVGDLLDVPSWDLIHDPTMTGGGIHQCAPEGRLAMHVDFNLLPNYRPHLLRVVNVILFVSEPGIAAADPGALVLGTGDEQVRIAPSPGTLVMFRADCGIWHGHPEPMNAMQPRRRSIPTYYYRELYDGEPVPLQHSTRFLDDA